MMPLLCQFQNPFTTTANAFILSINKLLTPPIRLHKVIKFEHCVYVLEDEFIALTWINLVKFATETRTLNGAT